MLRAVHDLHQALDQVQDLLHGLPTYCPTNELDAVITRMTKLLAYTKAHRAWHLGITEGIDQKILKRRMRAYFGYICAADKSTAKADVRGNAEANVEGHPEANTNDEVKPKASKNNKAKREADIYEELKQLGIRPQLINSVSYTVQDAKQLEPEVLNIMNDANIIMKFLTILMDHRPFLKVANDIMVEPEFDTSNLAEGNISVPHDDKPC
jgi:hypothetical protein